MGKAAMISVGDELLAGRIADTNAAWLSRRLREEGFPVVHRETVGDDVERIADSIRRCLATTDVVITGGGLGPTADDVTREGVARALGVDLLLNGDALRLIQTFFERAGRPMNEANRVQAMLPRGTNPIPNARGTAPGIWAEAFGKILAALPGVPHELEGMVELEVIPRLCVHPARGPAPIIRCLTVAGLPESELGQRLRDLMARGRVPSVGSYPATGTIDVVIEAPAFAGAEAMLEQDVAEVKRRLGVHVVAEGGVTLAEVVGRTLIERKLSIAVAESLTGGRVADLLVSVPGISAVFLCGVVAYGNAAKRELLGVKEETFRLHGAVSETCARQMAEGIRARVKAAIGVSTTGIAGPTGEVPGKPVGTVFAAVATDVDTSVEHRQLLGDRMQIRERSAVLALDLLRRVVSRK